MIPKVRRTVGWSYARAAAKYTQWLGAGSDASSNLNNGNDITNGVLFGGLSGSGLDVAANEGVADATFLKLPMTLAMAARGPQCFDVDYYMQRNAVSCLHSIYQ